MNNENEKDKIITEEMLEKSMRPIDYINYHSKDKKEIRVGFLDTNKTSSMYNDCDLYYA